MVFGLLSQLWPLAATTLTPILPAVSTPALTGALAGGAVTGALSLSGFWILSKRLHRMRLYDHMQRDLRQPMLDYVDWLHALSGDFSLWRRDMIPLYRPAHGRDQHELNRMRRLFVDPRSSNWFARLEEYEAMLAKFSPVVKIMWRHQADIGERFHRVLSHIEGDTAAAMRAAEELEGLAFEQAQLVSEFMRHVHYESLKGVIKSKPRAVAAKAGSRIRRTSLGGIRLTETVKT